MAALRWRSARPGDGLPVLVSDHVDGRSRSAVAAVRALAAAGWRPLVTTHSTTRSAAGASRWCAGVLRMPHPSEAGFRTAVESYLTEHPGALVLAASDAVLVALGLPGAELVDKSTLPARAAEAGLAVPPSREFDSPAEVDAAATELDYPLVVKPAVKNHPTEMARRVDSPADLPAALGWLSGPVVVQPFSSDGLRAVCGVIADGRLLAVVHQRYVRIWPADCGTASAAVTTEPDLELEARLPRLLDGHSGVFQVQLVGDEVIDVNPRVYGSLPLAVAAGANLAAIACRAAAGAEGDLVRGRPGVRYRWLEGDLRSVVHEVRSGTLRVGDGIRELVPHRGTAHSVESLRDPGPALVRVAEITRAVLA